MTGTAITPAPAGNVAVVDIGVGQLVAPSVANSFRVNAVAERLASHVASGQITNPIEFFRLCLSLARGIDYAIANREVPANAQDLPLLLKQICQRKNDLLLQAAIMVLMISVKNACKIGWFLDKDTEELFTLAKEIGSDFCSMGDISSEPNYSLPTISKIMARFYPFMKMGQILAFLEVKHGYGAFMIDFHISKNTRYAPQEKIRLFVAQADNIETSACIINPQHVDFLLNGKGVERRTNVSMDTGPQVPTNVTSMLKYGTNLLQAVGQFNGHYIIAVVFMSVTSPPDTPVLKYYVQPAVAALDSDSEIIEGPSRISLNCPISYTRIKTPVKGHSCKHLQCFDFSNFVEINSRRPSWRCPHCNQYVCYTDIRVDQNMVKVLREVGQNVADVIISAEGSWKAILESNDDVDQAHDKTINCQKEVSEQPESTSIPNAHADVLDLTEESDEMDVVGTYETEDRKPSQANLQSQSVAANQALSSGLNNTSGVDQNGPVQVEDDFWSGVYFNCGSDVQMVGGISEPTPANFMQPPVVTDAVLPALNQEAEGHRNTTLSTSVMQNEFSAPNNLLLHQSQFVNSMVNNEYGRSPSIPRQVSRTPVAIQALPVPSQTLSQQQRSRTSMNSLNPNGYSLASQAAVSRAPTADGFNTVYSDMERQQQFSRSHINPLPESNMASSSSQHQSTSQNWEHQDRTSFPGQSVQQVVGLPAPSQLPGAYRVSSGLLTDFQNAHLQQSLNPRTPQSMSQSSSAIRSSSHPPLTRIQQGGAQVGVGHIAGSPEQVRLMAAAQRVAQMARQSPSVPVRTQTSRTGSSSAVNANGFRASVEDQRGNKGRMVQTVSRTDGSVDLPSEQNWQPTGRMRGSLSGRAYSSALSQFMIQPTHPSQPSQGARPPSNMTPPPSSLPSQPSQGARPPSNMTPPPSSLPSQPSQGARPPSNRTPPPSSLPSQLQGLISNSMNIHVTQTHNKTN